MTVRDLFRVNSILVELRSPHFPKRLKIEIRREIKDWNIEEKIAYSQFSTRQVLLKAHTLKQALDNKIAALIERGEIRDAFDIEFFYDKAFHSHCSPNLKKLIC